jgi:arsenate reductase (thioredoxin)
MYRVLFLCRDNSLLSPMAEAYLKSIVVESVEVYSAGVNPKKISSEIVKILNEDGIDVSGFTTHSLSEYRHIDFDYILTFDAESEAESLHLPSRPVKYHFEFDRLLPEDKNGPETMELYRAIREKMKKTIRNFAKEHFAQANTI